MVRRERETHSARVSIVRMNERQGAYTCRHRQPNRLPSPVRASLKRQKMESQISTRTCSRDEAKAAKDEQIQCEPANCLLTTSGPKDRAGFRLPPVQ
jgi:light-regulated signal transduction histidine kinase (bacteriophytochrome)